MFNSQDSFCYRIPISHVWSTSTLPSGYLYPSSSCFIIFSFLFITSLPSPKIPFFYSSNHSASLVNQLLHQGCSQNVRVSANEKLCSVAVTRYKNTLDGGYLLTVLRLGVLHAGIIPSTLLKESCYFQGDGRRETQFGFLCPDPSSTSPLSCVTLGKWLIWATFAKEIRSYTTLLYNFHEN